MPTRPATIPAAVNAAAGELIDCKPPSASQRAMAADTDAQATTVRKSARRSRSRCWPAKRLPGLLLRAADLLAGSGMPERLGAGGAGRSCVFMYPRIGGEAFILL